MQAPKTIQRQAQGLRLQEKPFVIGMSGPFMRAGVKINLARLTAMMKQIFLRPGFDGYKAIAPMPAPESGSTADSNQLNAKFSELEKILKRTQS